MTSLEMKARVQFWMDNISGPRFTDSQINHALTSAQDRYVDEQCGIFNKQGDVKYIQLTQHSRDHLRSLIDIQDVSVTTNNLIAMADLPDGGDSLRYIIDINAYINGVKIPTDPLSYKDEKKIRRNPFRRPKLTYPEKIYVNESHDGYRLILPVGTICILAEIVYIMEAPAIKVDPTVADCILPVNAHNMICRYAAEHLALSIGNLEKLKTLKEYSAEMP